MTDNQKKILANRIKTDLKKEIESRNWSESSDYEMVADNGNIFAFNEYFICELRHHIFEPNEFEKADYDEIVSLIQQRLQLRSQALATERENKEIKLDRNPKLFYHSGGSREGAGSYPSRGMRRYHQFWGRKNGQDYHVNVAVDHPALNSVIFIDKYKVPKTGNYYLIEGAENLLSEPNIPQYWEVEGRFFKWAEVGDQITITPYEVADMPTKNIGCNKCGVEFRNNSIAYHFYEIINNKEVIAKQFCGKCWQEEEKNYRQKSSREKPVYKHELRSGKWAGEHCYYFKNGCWISLETGTPDPNTTNSEGKLSRLVTLVDSIQPPKGVKGDSWDYFYYVFATENGERFEVNALNPAIGFDAKEGEKELFPRAGDNGVRFWYKISWKATEPDKRRFEKGDFIEIEKWNGNASDKPLLRKNVAKILEKEWENKKNDTNKKLSIGIIYEFFREWDIKSIEITPSEDLLIEYSNGNSEIIKDDQEGTGIIKNNLKKILNKNKLDRQELEKLLTDSHSSKNAPSEKVGVQTKNDFSWTPWLIGGGIVITILGAVVIVYCRGRKKTK